MSKRIVITGMGVTSPLGNDAEAFWKALCEGRPGIGPVTAFDTADYPTKIAGEVRDLDFTRFVDAKEVRRNDRAILLGLAASHMALADSGLDLTNEDLDRIGVIVGSGVGGLSTMETEDRKLIARGPGRVSPFLIPMMIADMPAGRISMAHGLKGPNYAVVSACASAAHSLGDAFLMIKCGMMDAAVVGGTEAAITTLSFAGFCSMKAMSTRNDTPEKASSPFDIKRDGFVMGEGSGIVVMEALDHALARGAKIYGEMFGYGATGDAHHLTSPAPDGTGAQAAMRMALSSAGLAASDIDYINAHGTSTPLNDEFESVAIKHVFGESVGSVNISSTKSMTGHLLGASGGIEFIASLLAVRDGVIPPTINYEDPDPKCPLNYTPNKAVKRAVRYAMSNSFGFGGHNASLIVGKYEP
ncbi:MAG: beta-ketoacyl-ACP synthase II [Chitinispirillia bacterium]|nr:beta-ketoacyl-ACP synthase II [Chitinispirillia bacterium]MCL2241487.1 beta-ketoacyl-ACP synthase II [Chitinispirillia bacterium]